MYEKIRSAEVNIFSYVAVMAVVVIVRLLAGVVPAYLLAVYAGIVLTTVVCCLIEIWQSEVRLSEKIMWTVGFLIINFLALLLYFLMSRKRIRRHTDVQSTI